MVHRDRPFLYTSRWWGPRANTWSSASPRRTAVATKSFIRSARGPAGFTFRGFDWRRSRKSEACAVLHISFAVSGSLPTPRRGRVSWLALRAPTPGLHEYPSSPAGRRGRAIRKRHGTSSAIKPESGAHPLALQKAGDIERVVTTLETALRLGIGRRGEAGRNQPLFSSISRQVALALSTCDLPTIETIEAPAARGARNG